MTDRTDDLMKRLTSTDSTAELDAFLAEIRNKYPGELHTYLNAILKEKGLSPADAQKKSGIDRTYIYQILDGRKNPGRDKIVAIALACEMTLAECQRALEIAQAGILYPKNRRDCLMIYAINKKMSIMDLNSLLEEYELPPLD